MAPDLLDEREEKNVIASRISGMIAETSDATELAGLFFCIDDDCCVRWFCEIVKAFFLTFEHFEVNSNATISEQKQTTADTTIGQP